MTTAAEKTAVTTTNGATHEAPTDKRRALGRGLDSLLPSGPRVVAGTAVGAPNAASRAVSSEPGTVAELHAQAAGDAVMDIALDQIDNNPYQTRQNFREQALNDLAESIRASGVVQPVVVRQGANGRYVLILGERRCRASKLAGKTTVPAIVRTVSELQAAEMTVIENLQRQDLNCMEQATAFSKLSQDFKLTQEQIGKRVGISRESVANYMRLLRLPYQIQHHLLRGELGFSEARVLLQFGDDLETMARIAEMAVARHLSVEQLENLVDQTKFPPLPEKKEGSRGARWQDPNVRALQTQLERNLGVRVRISDKKGKGTIRIEYATLEDFDRVLGVLTGKEKSN
jgi:ParB family chromosome partitioning protein